LRGRRGGRARRGTRMSLTWRRRRRRVRRRNR